MSQVTLHPCKLRGTKIILDREVEPQVFEWKPLVEKLAPSRSRSAQTLLLNLRMGEFVGTRRQAGAVTNFKVAIPSGNIAPLLKAQPSFRSDLIEVYKVLRTEWDAQLTEPVAEAAR